VESRASNDRDQYRDDFIDFLQISFHGALPKQAAGADQAQPLSGFASFFQSYTGLGDKVGFRLTAGGLFQVRTKRRSCVEKLRRNCPRSAFRFAKRSIEFDGPASEAKCTLVDLGAVHARWGAQNPCRPELSGNAAQAFCV
jgi:hypothetical protein